MTKLCVLNFEKTPSVAQTWTGNMATVVWTKLSSWIRSGHLPGVLRLLMKEFFGVVSSSSKSNSVGLGGLKNKNVYLTRFLRVVAAKCGKDSTLWKTILTCAPFQASPFLSPPPLPHPDPGRGSVRAWGASEAEACSSAPASPLWPAAHRVFWSQQEEASSSWGPRVPRHCREPPTRPPLPRPSSPPLPPRLHPTGPRPSAQLLLLHLCLRLRWRHRCLSESWLFLTDCLCPDGLKLFQLLVHHFSWQSNTWCFSMKLISCFYNIVLIVAFRVKNKFI